MTILQNQSELSVLLPLSAYVTILFNRKSKKDLGTFLNKYEIFLNKPLVLTVLVLLTMFIGNHIKPKTPNYLKRIFSNSFSKYMGLVLITFTLTHDIELAFTTTVTFLLLLQMLRTEEEKEAYPYLI